MNPQLEYPFDTLPAAGEKRQTAPGMHWIRMPLPFALDHINLWLIVPQAMAAALRARETTELLTMANEELSHGVRCARVLTSLGEVATAPMASSRGCPFTRTYPRSKASYGTCSTCAA